MKFNPANIQSLRKETPGTTNRVHFNNAGAALMPQPVLTAIQSHLELEANLGGYEAAAATTEKIQHFYRQTARLVNAAPHNIAYASSATDAYNRALSSIPFNRGDVILTTRDDYVSNQIAFLQLQKRFKVQLIRCPNTSSGEVDVSEMEKMIERYSPKLVAVTHVPTSSGLVQPIEAVGRICQDRGIWYLVDACQSAGQMPLDVQKIHCDFLSATFRKFLRGPRGAGFLYASDRVLQNKGFSPLFLDLHSASWKAPGQYEPAPDAKRFEQWERPYALLCGAGACVDYALGIGLDHIMERVELLADQCRNKLKQIPGIRVLDRGKHRCGIVTIEAKGWPATRLKQALSKRHINTSVVEKSSALIDFEEKAVTSALRISPHYYNTTKEIDELCKAVLNIIH